MKERTINCIEYVGLCMMLISSIAWHYLNYDIFFVIQTYFFVLVIWLVDLKVFFYIL